MNRRTAFCFMTMMVLGAIAATQVSAQLIDYKVQSETSNLYVRSVYIEEVNMTRYGYRLTYRSGNGQLAITHLPLRWFGAAGGKGSVMWTTTNKASPFMDVVFVDNEFSHVNLFLPANFGSLIYKPADPTRDWEEVFAGVEALNILY